MELFLSGIFVEPTDQLQLLTSNRGKVVFIKQSCNYVDPTYLFVDVDGAY